MRRSLPWLAHVAALAALSASATSQQLPLLRYGVAEGLPSERVNALAQDEHGFLWIGTWEGLARFDGERFECSAREAGLENALVTALAFDTRGELWLGTYGGVAHLLDDPSDARPFEVVHLGSAPRDDQVTAIAFENATSLWCGTNGGLVHIDLVPGQPLAPRRVLPESVGWPACFVRDDAGRLWCATSAAFVRLEQGRVAERIETIPGGAGSVIAFAPAVDGSVFVVSEHAVHRAPRGKLSAPPAWELMPVEIAGDERARCALLDSTGMLWIGTTQGLVTWQDGRVNRVGPPEGVPDDILLALCEDRDENIWIGSSAQGLHRLVARNVLNFTTASGLQSPNAVWLTEARDASIVVSTLRGLARIESGRVECLAGGSATILPGMSVLQDRHADWWLIDRGRVIFVAGPDLDLARAHELDERNGLPAGTAYGQVFEDRAGVLMISTFPRFLSRRVADIDGEPRFESAEIPALREAESAPRILVELSNGDLWFAPHRDLFRRRGDRITTLDVHTDRTLVDLRSFCLDARGTLWLGSRFEGVYFVRDPSAEVLRFEHLETRDALQSQAVFAVAEDRTGHVWFGTGHGLDRLGVDASLVHYGTAQGLAGEIVHRLLVDSSGALWAATSGGVSRFDLSAREPTPASPDVRIVTLSVAGSTKRIAQRGARELDLGTLASGEGELQLEFTAPSLRRERELSFEYRLGATREWTDLGARRSLNFARLAPDAYRVEIRAHHGHGAPGGPALLVFEVAPPFWRTAWFALAILCTVALILWTLHRSRVSRLLALAAIRRQIASDVHDEMGAGLAQIAVLAEVARREPGLAAEGRLSEVARLARSLRESMSDIVWAVDPRQDSFASLVERLRHAAHNLFESQGVHVEFEAPSVEVLSALELAPDRRRQVYLIIKEALTNAARHARAQSVRVAFECREGSMRARVSDDGVGFAPDSILAGHGLSGIRRRVAEMGGQIAIASDAGGTQIELTLPIARP